MTTNPSGTELPNKPGGSVRSGTTQPDPGTGSGSGFGPVTVGDVLNGTDPSTLEGTTSSGQDGVEPDGEVIPEKTIVVVEGGGGVGCVAKPIFDRFGALLHIRVVHGGFGYKTPPNVRIIDPNQKGAGDCCIVYW